MRRIEKRGVVNVLCDDYGCSPATKAEAEFFDEIERLRAEVEALRADADDAARYRYVNGPNGWIEKLRVAVEDLTADRDSWRDQASARAADAVRFMQERDAARAEVEALKAKNEKLWRWYNTAEQALATERGRSFKSAADRWQKVVEKLQAEVVSREAAIAEALQIVRVYAARNPLHDYNGVMQDPHGAHAWLMRNDAARAAQGDKP